MKRVTSSVYHNKAYEGKYEELKEDIANDKKILLAKDDSGRQLLHWAALGGQPELASYLIAEGSPVNECDHSGWTPLIISSSAGRIQVTRLLIGKNAHINAINHCSHSALQYAASKNHTEIVSILIENGADVNTRDCLGETPLHRAALKGYMKTMEFLLDSNMCGRDLVNQQGNTPLHLACEQENVQAARLLIERGALTTIRNKEGKLPSDMLRYTTFNSLL